MNNQHHWVLAIAFCLLLPGCTPPGTVNSDANSDGRGNGKVAVGKDGQQSAKYPAACASVIPQYPGSKCTVCVDSSEQAVGASLPASGWSITLATTDNASKVIDFYRSFFENNGWKNTGESSANTSGVAGGGMAGISATKDKDNASIMVTTGTAGQPGNIQLTISQVE